MSIGFTAFVFVGLLWFNTYPTNPWIAPPEAAVEVAEQWLAKRNPYRAIDGVYTFYWMTEEDVLEFAQNGTS